MWREVVECGELVGNKEKKTFRFRRLGCRRSIGIYMDDWPFSRWCPLVHSEGSEGRKEGRKDREWVNSFSSVDVSMGNGKSFCPQRMVIGGRCDLSALVRRENEKGPKYVFGSVEEGTSRIE